MSDTLGIHWGPFRTRASVALVCVASIAGLAGGLTACASLAGLTAGAGDAGTPRDSGPRSDGAGLSDATGSDAGAAAEGGDAGKAPGAAVVVSSGSLVPVWCVVTVNGDVECWGDNEVGELGNGTMIASATPVKVLALPGPVTQVSVGYASVCALTRSGGVWCWGYGLDGELGNGSMTPATSTPLAVTALGSDVISLSVGYEAACAAKSDGSVWCWGAGSAGMLGTGQADDALSPVKVLGLSGSATSVSVGGTTACAVVAGGVSCWGAADGEGELGNGTVNGSPTPVPVMGLSDGITAVSVGDSFVCALTVAGAVECWGNGTDGQLGNGELAVSPMPVAVSGLTSGVIAISAGVESVTALARDGTLMTWGFGEDGDLGTGTPELLTGTPVSVTGLSGVATTITTGAAPCAVLVDGSVACWGQTAELALTPVTATGLGMGASAVSIGGDYGASEFVCALTSVGAIECWGGNDDGELGNGSTSDSSIPSPSTAFFGGVSALAAGPGGDSACAVQSGLVQCWGDNTYGQLGNGNTVSSTTAVPVLDLTSGVSTVAVGCRSACAVTTAGDAWCWGDNSYGELGNQSTTSSTVPVKVQGLGAEATAVSVGCFYACALLSDGTVDCWGKNGGGELGNGSTTTTLAPTPVSGLSRVTAISAGWFSACAVTSAGSIECWGNNDYGQLGSGNEISSARAFPVDQISSGATKVAVGQQSACAIVNGGAQCWGSEALGSGTYLDDELLPVPVAGLTSGVTDIAVGTFAACAVASGGIQCWGINSAGQLGNGGARDGLSPTAVPGFP